MSEESKLDISRIVVIGRTYEEYMAMFDLKEEEIVGKKILDCPSGVCSFTAIANRLGAEVTASDIAYYHHVEQLLVKGMDDLEHVMQSLEHVRTNYVWDYYESIDHLKQHRAQALAACIEHMRNHPDRYVPAVLPTLPFADRQFDMTLSAHFLFMYADRLDYDFHVDTITELLRVTRREVRIYPLVDLASRRYAELDRLVDDLGQRGYSSEEVQVGYEFVRGASSMLRIRVPSQQGLPRFPRTS